MADETGSGDERGADVTSPWGFGATADRGQPYAELVGALRRLQDLVACGDPPPSCARLACDYLRQASTQLEQFEKEPRGLNIRGDISGHDDALIVPVWLNYWDPDSAEGTVRFSSFYHGGGGGVHGGAIALLFDDFIGRLANFHRITRTAYLHVNYRAVCPIGEDLVVRGRVARRDGRKLFLSGTLTHGDASIADCEGLWVVLRSSPAGAASAGADNAPAISRKDPSGDQ